MDFETFRLKVSKRIKDLRIQANLSQEAISGLDLSVRAYQRIESGEAVPTLESLFILAKSLGIHPKEFLNIPLGKDEREKRR